MPAFTFEKISPPLRRGPVAPVAKKRRGLIAQIRDRLAEARVKRSPGAEKSAISSPQSNSAD
jgi:hypothetical protein